MSVSCHINSPAQRHMLYDPSLPEVMRFGLAWITNSDSYIYLCHFKDFNIFISMAVLNLEILGQEFLF